MKDFNFDEWSDLFKKSPGAFERKKQELLSNAITEITSDVEVQTSLRTMINNVNQSLDETTSPTERFETMSKQFHVQSGKLKAVINSPEWNDLKSKYQP